MEPYIKFWGTASSLFHTRTYTLASSPLYPPLTFHKLVPFQSINSIYSPWRFINSFTYLLTYCQCNVLSLYMDGYYMSMWYNLFG